MKNIIIIFAIFMMISSLVESKWGIPYSDEITTDDIGGFLSKLKESHYFLLIGS